MPESAYLRKLWQSKTDAEISEAAAHIYLYTPETQSIIDTEVSRRGITQPIQDQVDIVKSQERKYFSWGVLSAATISLVAIVCISVYIANLYEQTETSTESSAYATKYLRISADEILADYEANGIAADTKYKGEMVVVSGKVEEIDKDIMGTPYVLLRGRSSSWGVQCTFDHSDASVLAPLSKGQSVGIRGKVKGKFMFVVVTDSWVESY